MERNIVTNSGVSTVALIDQNDGPAVALDSGNGVIRS